MTTFSYVDAVLRQTPRLLGMMDRTPMSLTRGSFDREHWAWKFRDFPLGMAQSGLYPLAQLWTLDHESNPYRHSTRLLEWIAAGVEGTAARQHRDGSFDAFAPNERDAGPTVGVAYALTRTLLTMGDALPEATTTRALDSIRGAADFALTRAENHAFVSNHWAVFGHMFLDTAQLLGAPQYRARADEIVARILAEQSSDGWYREYGGPDAGYETLGIYYMAKVYRDTGDADVLASLTRACDFLAYCVHPDGSLGGAYGSRHTALYYPGGLELLKDDIPSAAAIAAFMRDRIELSNVVTLESTDAENLPSLMSSYLTAHGASGGAAEAPTLPCRSFDGVRRFEESGVIVAGTPAYYGVFHGLRGGIGRVYDKSDARLVFEDTGYIGRLGNKPVASQYSDMPASVEIDGSEARMATTFAEIRQLLATPVSYLGLRVLNLTAFRIRALGNLIRNLTVRALIMRRDTVPLRLEREIRFGPTSVTIRDRLKKSGGARLSDLRLSRGFVGIHMGSARYFTANELPETFSPDLGDAETALNERGAAEVSFDLTF